MLFKAYHFRHFVLIMMQELQLCGTVGILHNCTSAVDFFW